MNNTFIGLAVRVAAVDFFTMGVKAASLIATVVGLIGIALIILGAVDFAMSFAGDHQDATQRVKGLKYMVAGGLLLSIPALVIYLTGTDDGITNTVTLGLSLL